MEFSGFPPYIYCSPETLFALTNPKEDESRKTEDVTENKKDLTSAEEGKCQQTVSFFQDKMPVLDANTSGTKRKAVVLHSEDRTNKVYRETLGLRQEPLHHHATPASNGINPYNAFKQLCSQESLRLLAHSSSAAAEIIDQRIDEAKITLNDQDMLKFIGVLVLENWTKRIEEIAKDRSLSIEQIQMAIIQAINDPYALMPREDYDLTKTFVPFLTKIGLHLSNPLLADRARALYLSHEITINPRLVVAEIAYICDHSERGLFINFLSSLSQKLPRSDTKKDFPEILFTFLLDAEKLNFGVFSETTLDQIILIINNLRSRNFVIPRPLQLKLATAIPLFINALDDDYVKPSVKPTRIREMLESVGSIISEQKLLSLIEASDVVQVRENVTNFNRIDDASLKRALIKSASPAMVEEMRALRPSLFTHLDNLMNEAIQANSKFEFLHALDGYPTDYSWSSLVPDHKLLEAIKRSDPFFRDKPDFFKIVIQRIPIDDQLDVFTNYTNHQFLKNVMNYITQYDQINKICTQRNIRVILNCCSHETKLVVINIVIEKAKSTLNNEDFLRFLSVLAMENLTERTNELALERSFTMDQVQKAIIQSLNEPEAYLPRIDHDLQQTCFAFLEKIGIHLDNPDLANHIRALYLAYNLTIRPRFFMPEIEFIARNHALRGLFVRFLSSLVKKIPAFPNQENFPDILFDILLNAEKLNEGVFSVSMLEDITSIIKNLREKNLLIHPSSHARLVTTTIPAFISNLDTYYVSHAIKLKTLKDLQDAVSCTISKLA